MLGEFPLEPLFRGAPLLSGPILGLAAFLWATVGLGVVVPMTPLIVSLGVAIAMGTAPTAALVWLNCGALLGSGLSYEIGRCFGSSPLVRTSLLKRARDLGLHVFTGSTHVPLLGVRLVGALLGIASLGAGLAHLPRRMVYAKSLVANLAWVSLATATGLGGAFAWRALGAVDPRGILVVSVISLVAILTGIACHRGVLTTPRRSGGIAEEVTAP